MLTKEQLIKAFQEAVKKVGYIDISDIDIGELPHVDEEVEVFCEYMYEALEKMN